MTSLSDIVLKIGDSIKFRHLALGLSGRGSTVRSKRRLFTPIAPGSASTPIYRGWRLRRRWRFAFLPSGSFFVFATCRIAKTSLLSLRRLWRAARSLRQWRATRRPLEFCRA